jgi:hypothetical protein
VPGLLAFGPVYATPMPEYLDHFALVRQINAEVGHIPESALEAWQDAGPRRVQAALVAHLQAFVERGWMRPEDPQRTATHFMLLVAREVASRSYFGAVPLDDAEIAAIATDGVRAFLRAYAPQEGAERLRP